MQGKKAEAKSGHKGIQFVVDKRDIESREDLVEMESEFTSFVRRKLLKHAHEKPNHTFI